MKASEFKKILKPLIEQTVKEVLLKEGVLSRIVAEVAKGLNPTLTENVKQEKQAFATAEDKHAEAEQQEKQRQERIKRLNESVGFGTSVFDDVVPVSENDTKTALAGVSSTDGGVDISGIQKLANGKWKQLAGTK